ncbi:hypothetical protein [Sphingosinicella sp. BN140058]|uniref:hypothetical protein n=1 Tax=Sphingosinicella sp. BN140058 TaxID=1892855 RepID=UPI0010100C28|nr:hypothetical protein [Sphingosinicella sp. BN140058]QAY76950.1 hypothetical protein ETR14_10915 [Sphingosinicella sp. BN140058]
MGYYPKPSSPRALIADIRAFAQQRSAVQWGALATAIIMPTAIIILFIIDGDTNIRPGPKIIYAESWSAERTDAEIIADQKRDQARREAAIKERQQQFKRLEQKMEKLGI